MAGLLYSNSIFSVADEGVKVKSLLLSVALIAPLIEGNERFPNVVLLALIEN